MIGSAAADNGDEKEEVKHSEGGNTEMKHNVFENENKENTVVLIVQTQKIITNKIIEQILAIL